MLRSRWVAMGLFASTFATLLLEILDSRLLSVVTWYHLSFLAVSLAMLGMAAGAVHVFLGRHRYHDRHALDRLPALSIAFAIAIAASHLINLCIPIPTLTRFAVMELVAVAAATTVLAIPFYFSGIVVTVALTRTGGAIGRLYAWDLAGAAAGCLAVGPLLGWSGLNLTSNVLLAAAAAAVGGWCFAKGGGSPLGRRAAMLAVLLVAAALVNGSRPNGIEVAFPKNRNLWMATDTFAGVRWNSHSYVILQHPVTENRFFWGPGRLAPSDPARIAWLAIDGEAGTAITEWDGRVESLDWVKHDVTTLPYLLRRGSTAVIGVGGGRDVLSAIWGRSTNILGIEVNEAVLDFLSRKHRNFAKISTHPTVRLVHDDARAHLTRTDSRFDIIQMSLIDTWASTGAGAFTLSENGLYTVEAWKVFLARLTAQGVFSVSRWFAPENVSETNRLLALAVATLQQTGVSRPLSHLLLVSRGRTATLLVSREPFKPEDEAIVTRVAAEEEFTLQVTPWTGGSNHRLDRIARSSSAAELSAATDDLEFDYSPPTDERPFFFNMLKPASFTRIYTLPRGGVMWGNMRATATLVLLFVIAAILVLLIIVVPLIASGWPAMPRVAFGSALAYFAGIGLAFMLVQIALLQRFTVYLGHPAYTFSVILFGMILFAGTGSYISDFATRRIAKEHLVVPFAAASLIVLIATLVGPVTQATIAASLPTRIAVVLGLLAPVATILGFFFPAGIRAVSRLSPDGAAWMWGINGAFSVLGSIVAVGVSLWVGIQANLHAASLLYAALALPLSVLARAARRAVPDALGVTDSGPLEFRPDTSNP